MDASRTAVQAFKCAVGARLPPDLRQQVVKPVAELLDTFSAVAKQKEE